MSHTTRLLHQRVSARATAQQGKLSRQQEEELLSGVSLVRNELRGWDRMSKNARKLLLQRFLWLHGPEGAGIGAARGPNSALTPAEPSLLQSSSSVALPQEAKESLAAPSLLPASSSSLFPSLSSTLLLGSGGAGPSALASASLESLYGAGASLLLMRVLSWLRLTYTLRVANLACLRALCVFVEDAQGGTAFVHELVEGGGVRTMLAICEMGQQTHAHAQAQAHSLMGDSSAKAATTQQQQHASDQAAERGGNRYASSNSSEQRRRDDAGASVRAVQQAAAHSARQLSESAAEQELALSVLLRVALTGRRFKELICEAGGVAIVLQCLASAASVVAPGPAAAADAVSACAARTAQVAKALLCQLGLGNPRYASLLHEELLGVFRSMAVAAAAVNTQDPSSSSSNQVSTNSNNNNNHAAKRLVLQTLHFLLSNTSSTNAAQQQQSQQHLSSDSVSSLHFGSDAASAAGGESFSADARYVDATVSLFHIQDLALHYEASQLLKLLASPRHGLGESVLQALVALLRQKATNALVSPGSARDAAAAGSGAAPVVTRRRSSSSEGANGGAEDASKRAQERFGLGGFAAGIDGAITAARAGALGSGGGGGSAATSKHSDPKTLAARLLNALCLSSYELCLRLTQLGAIPLLLSALCHLDNFDLQHAAAMLLYTLHNNVQESASLIRIMLSGGGGGGGGGTANAAAADKQGDSLYRSFLARPDSLHRHLTSADVSRIHSNLHNPQLASTFLSQRRLERRSMAANNAAGTGGSGGGTGSRRGSASGAAGQASASAGAAVNAASVAGLGSRALLPSRGSIISSGSGGVTGLALAEALASGAGGGGGSDTGVRPQLAPDHPSLLRSGSLSGAAGLSSAPSLLSPLSGAFLATPGAATMATNSNHASGAEQQQQQPVINLEEEDAAFFARGVATVARRDLAKEEAAAAAAAKKEKEATAAALAAQSAESAAHPRVPSETLSSQADKEDTRENVVALMQRSATASKTTLHKAAAKAKSNNNGEPFVPHKDAISVPIMSLHFDPRLKLATMGPPSGLSLAAAAASAAQAVGNAQPAGKTPRRHAGVHEGEAHSSTQIDATTGAAQATSAPLYTPFASPELIATTFAATQAAAAAAEAAAIAASATATARSAQTNAAAAGSAAAVASAAPQLVFAKRVGGAGSAAFPGAVRSSALPSALASDPISDGMLRQHFKDLSRPDRSVFLTHGAASMDGAADAGDASGDHGKHDSLDVAALEEQHEPLLPAVMPHVEILDGVAAAAAGGASAADSKALAEAKQAALRKRREEKRAKEATTAALAAEKHAASHKYGAGVLARDVSAKTGVYEGFTGDTMAREKTADEFKKGNAHKFKYSNLVAADERARAQQQQQAVAEAKAATTEALGGGGGSSSSPLKGGNKEGFDSSSLQVSNRSILALAIAADTSGRSFDPRRWGKRPSVQMNSSSINLINADAAAGTASDAVGASSLANASSEGSPNSPVADVDDASSPSYPSFLSVSPSSAAASSTLFTTPARPVLRRLNNENEAQRADRLQMEADLQALRAGVRSAAGGGGGAVVGPEGLSIRPRLNLDFNEGTGTNLATGPTSPRSSFNAKKPAVAGRRAAPGTAAASGAAATTTAESSGSSFQFAEPPLFGPALATAHSSGGSAAPTHPSSSAGSLTARERRPNSRDFKVVDAAGNLNVAKPASPSAQAQPQQQSPMLGAMSARSAATSGSGIQQGKALSRRAAPSAAASNAPAVAAAGLSSGSVPKGRPRGPPSGSSVGTSATASSSSSPSSPRMLAPPRHLVAALRKMSTKDYSDTIHEER